MLPIERIAYSAIKDRPRLALPGGARLAVWVIVNIEEWNPRETMPRTVLTPPAGGSPMPDIPNWAWHEYGNRVGFWRMLEVLDRFNIRAALAINGSAIQAYEPIARAALARAWEFVGHGFGQKNMQKVPDERADIAKTTEVIQAFTGRRPRGWLGPGLTETWDTPDILAEEGMLYDSSIFPVRHDRYGVPAAPRWPFRARAGVHSLLELPPARFEPGVPPAPEAAGLGAAIDYLTTLGMDNVAAHEESLTAHALDALREINGVRILGPDTTKDRGGAVAFEVEGVHPHDVGQVLDELGVAVRTGHHCAWPLHRALGVQASTRATFYVYNNHAEVQALADGIRYAQRFFGARQ